MAIGGQERKVFPEDGMMWTDSRVETRARMWETGGLSSGSGRRAESRGPWQVRGRRQRAQSNLT